MKTRKFLKILSVTVVALLLIGFLAALIIKPLIRKKLEAGFNRENSDYVVTISKFKTTILPPGLELDSVTIVTKKDYSGILDLKGVIESIKIRGISLIKAVLKKDLDIRKIIFLKSSFKVNISSPRDTVIPIVLPVNVKIGIVLFDSVDLAVEKSVKGASYSISDGVFKLYDVLIGKQDTLSSEIINLFDFKAKKLASVSSDGMHSFTVRGISYSVASKILTINRLNITPNFANYDFTDRYKFQKCRIEAGLSNLFIYDFSALEFFRSGDLISSNIEIGKMDMKVFKDKRKEFRHVTKPVFQDMIYNYRGTIRIDKISLKNGDIIYAEHNAEANELGSISFNNINARIYNICNDTHYRTRYDSLKLTVNALLMGKGKTTIILKGKNFDSQNTFSLEGTLTDLEASELNPILEKSAFVYATSGKIDFLNFSFTANNDKATGKLTMLYHDLYIAVKNKQTDDTTAFRERFISYIANMKVMDSNPVRGKDPRVGIIYYKRDPERFLFHYCFRSILTGISSSLVRNPKEMNN